MYESQRHANYKNNIICNVAQFTAYLVSCAIWQAMNLANIIDCEVISTFKNYNINYK